MMTKIASDENVPYMFMSATEEAAYWAEICPICNLRDCNDDCIYTVAGSQICFDCDGEGKVRFIHRPIMDPNYMIVTKCGMCDGIGLV